MKTELWEEDFGNIKNAKWNKTLLQKVKLTLEEKQISKGNKQVKEFSMTTKKWEDKNNEKAKHIFSDGVGGYAIQYDQFSYNLYILGKRGRVNSADSFTLLPWKV